MRVLVTRPQRDAQAIAARLVAAGHKAILAPVIEIVATGARPISHNYEGLIATSAHALELLDDASRETLRSVTLHIVGERTHNAARANGFFHAGYSCGNSAQLCEQLCATTAPQSGFLYLAGRDRKAALEAVLKQAGHHVEALVVYEARALPALSDAAIHSLRENAIDTILHYSRRSATLFLDLARKAGLELAPGSIQHICISADAAEPLRAAGHATRIAATPDSQGLFSALKSL